MESGVIQGPQELSWQKERHFAGRAEFQRDAVLLSEHSFMRGSCVSAHLCRACKKLIIDYSDKE